MSQYKFNYKGYAGIQPIGYSDMQLQELDAIFDMLDVDGDGSLNARELRIAYANIDIPLCLPVVQERVKALDADGNGVVDYAEFLTLIREGYTTGFDGSDPPPTASKASKLQLGAKSPQQPTSQLGSGKLSRLQTSQMRVQMSKTQGSQQPATQFDEDGQEIPAPIGSAAGYSMRPTSTRTKSNQLRSQRTKKQPTMQLNEDGEEAPIGGTGNAQDHIYDDIVNDEAMNEDQQENADNISPGEYLGKRTMQGYMSRGPAAGKSMARDGNAQDDIYDDIMNDEAMNEDQQENADDVSPGEYLGKRTMLGNMSRARAAGKSMSRATMVPGGKSRRMSMSQQAPRMSEAYFSRNKGTFESSDHNYSGIRKTMKSQAQTFRTIDCQNRAKYK